MNNLQAATQPLFQRFQSTGSLGEAAKRQPMLMDPEIIVGQHTMGAELILGFDNQDGIDSDKRDNFFKMDKAALQKAVNQGFDELVGPTPELTPEVAKRMREELEKEAADGTIPPELLEALKEAEANPNPPKPFGEYIGEVRKEGNNLSYVCESTGDEHDMEYLTSDGSNLTFLNVTDKGDHFEAKGVRVADGKAYQETWSGDWNLLPQ